MDVATWPSHQPISIVSDGWGVQHDHQRQRPRVLRHGRRTIGADDSNVKRRRNTQRTGNMQFQCCYMYIACVVSLCMERFSVLKRFVESISIGQLHWLVPLLSQCDYPITLAFAHVSRTVLVTNTDVARALVLFCLLTMRPCNWGPCWLLVFRFISLAYTHLHQADPCIYCALRVMSHFCFIPFYAPWLFVCVRLLTLQCL